MKEVNPPEPRYERASNDVTTMMTFEANRKSAGVAYLAWFFLGGLGVHRFYLGRTGSGIAMLILFILGWLLVTVGVGVLFLGIVVLWWIIDAFLIPGITSRHNNNLVTRLSGGPIL